MGLGGRRLPVVPDRTGRVPRRRRLGPLAVRSAGRSADGRPRRRGPRDGRGLRPARRRRPADPRRGGGGAGVRSGAVRSAAGLGGGPRSRADDRPVRPDLRGERRDVVGIVPPEDGRVDQRPAGPGVAEVRRDLAADRDLHLRGIGEAQRAVDRSEAGGRSLPVPAPDPLDPCGLGAVPSAAARSPHTARLRPHGAVGGQLRGRPAGPALARLGAAPSLRSPARLRRPGRGDARELVGAREPRAVLPPRR